MDLPVAQMPRDSTAPGSDEFTKLTAPEAQNILAMINKRFAQLREKKAEPIMTLRDAMVQARSKVQERAFFHTNAPINALAFRQLLKSLDLADGRPLKLCRDQLIVHESEERKLGQGAQGGVWQGTMIRRSMLAKKETLVAVKDIPLVAVGSTETVWEEGKVRPAYAELKAMHRLTSLGCDGSVALLGAQVVTRKIPAGDFTSLRIAMELAQKSMRTVIEDGKYTDAQALDMSIQVVRALAQVHAAEMAHLDVKPDNILCFEGGKLKLTDFGMAASLHDTEVLHECRGTPTHVAPEMYRPGLKSEKADIFSVCVTLWEIFVRRNADHTKLGNTPGKMSKVLQGVKEGKTQPSVYPEILYGLLQTRPGQIGVATDLQAIVVQGLSLEPSHRQTAHELLEQLLSVRAARQQAQEPVKQCEPVMWSQMPSAEAILKLRDTMPAALTDMPIKAVVQTVSMADTQTVTHAYMKAVTDTTLGTEAPTETGSATQTITDPLAVGVALIAMEKQGAEVKQGVQADDGDKVSTHKSTRGWKISAVWDNLTSSLKRQSSGHSTEVPSSPAAKPVTNEVSIPSKRQTKTKTQPKRKGFLKSLFTGCMTPQEVFLSIVE